MLKSKTHIERSGMGFQKAKHIAKRFGHVVLESKDDDGNNVHDDKYQKPRYISLYTHHYKVGLF